jgi:hypothetical protein
MRWISLAALTAFAGVVGGCGSPTDRWVHEGDSGYYYNYEPAPTAPQMDSLVAGDARIVVYFTTSFSSSAAVCSPVSAGGYGNTVTARSPVTVDKLTNGVEYRCTAYAFNTGRASPASASLNATPKAP